jgi:hypothetical protein
MSMARPSLPLDEIAALCGARIVHVSRLERLGLDRTTIAKHCRPGGPWRRLLPGVVKLNNGPPTRDDRRRAALIYCGRRTVLTGADALALYGMERMPSPSGPVHVLIDEDCRRSGSGRVLAERTIRLPVARPGRWPLAPITRAALDLCRRLTDRNEVRATLAEVVQRGRCSPIELSAELEAGSGRGSALPRAVLREIGVGVRSVAEAQARELVLQSGLPLPLWNPTLFDRSGRFVAMPDVWFDDVALAWEIDSRQWHLGPADHERTLDQHSRLTAAGATVLRSSPTTLALDRERVLEELGASYARAASRPRPNLIAVPADPDLRAALS